MRTKTNLAFGIALLILIVISAVSYLSTLALLQTVKEQSRTESMITAIEATLAGLNGAEGAQRGYMITDDTAHLPRYRENLKAVDSALLQLDTLAAAFPEAVPQIDSLTTLVDIRIARFTERLALYEAEGLDALRDEFNGDPEDLNIAVQAHRLANVVRGELADHAADASRQGRTTLGVIVLGGVAAVLLVLFAMVVIGHEHNERIHAYQELREEGLKNAQFLESLPQGVFVLKANGSPAYANVSAKRILGRGIVPNVAADNLAEVYAAYVAGTNRIYPAERVPIVAALGGVASTIDDMEVERDAARIPLEVTAAPIYDSNGNITAAIAAFTDISERRAVERMKDELISVVSHELRTPLTSIRGALGLVGSGRLGTLNQQGTRMIDIAIADTDRLVRLINDMLDLERMQAGRKELHLQPSVAHELVRQAVEPILPLADKAGVQIACTTSDARVNCDNDRIVQTLTNLISNALKFSPAGAVIEVNADVSVRKHEVCFSVSDQGHGIPQSKLHTIFERFQQIDASDAREKGGAGLGLAIARSIVEQHRGRIWAESDGATGSTFFFTLPLAPPEADDRDAAPGLTKDGGARGETVLIVEDDANLSSVLAALFADAGLRSVHASNSEAAIALAQEAEPALLVLDLRLPDHHGRHVIEWLKQRPRRRDMPVIVYTALDLNDMDKTGLQLGPTVFLTKARSGPVEVVDNALRLLDLAKSGSTT